MSTYVTLYIVFGALFLVGVAGYWVATRLFADHRATYLPPEA